MFCCSVPLPPSHSHNLPISHSLLNSSHISLLFPALSKQILVSGWVVGERSLESAIYIHVITTTTKHSVDSLPYTHTERDRERKRESSYICTLYTYIDMATLWNGEKVAQIVRCFNFFVPFLVPASTSSLYIILYVCVRVACFYFSCYFFLLFSPLPSSFNVVLIVCVSSAVAVAALSACGSNCR